MVRRTMRYRYVVFGIAAAAYFLVFFHRMSTAVMAPDLSADFGIDPAQVGLFGSMYFYAYAFFQLPCGLLADRWGPRKTTSVFLLAAGIGSLLFGITDSFNMALVARFMVGLGLAFIYVSSMLLIAEWFSSKEYTTYVGVMVSIGNFGSLAASAPLVAMIGAIGWRNSMVSIGLISILVAALLYALVRNKPEEIGGADPNQISKTVSQPLPQMSITQVLKVLMKKREFWTLALLMFGWAGTLLALHGLWFGPYLMNVYHLSKQQAGNLIMFIAIGAIIGSPLIGFITDKIAVPKKKLVMAGALSMIIMLVLLIFFVDTMSLGFLTVMMFLFGIFGYTTMLEWTYLKEIVDFSMYGTASGIINFSGFLGGAVFQQVLGIIIAKAPVTNNYIAASGFKSAFLFCFVYLIIALAIFSIKRKQSDKFRV